MEIGPGRARLRSLSAKKGYRTKMIRKDSIRGQTHGAIDAQTFRRKFRLLIFNAWNVPAIFGLSFILYVQILSVPEMIAVMTNPLEPLFVITWIAFSLWYFTRWVRPVVAYLENPTEESGKAALNCIRLFPMHFWVLFFTYLIMAPISVIWAAELYADFVPKPVDWFRISMVALIVSIIVGLPIFFMILDLFGRALTGVPLARAHVTVRTKVFLIGALVPLLIDTMLVQYYWSRTGFFTTETFVVWLFLELLAIGGSLIFVRSFGQSLAPLETIVGGKRSLHGFDLEALRSQSTDEIGVLTTAYRDLLQNLQIQSEMLELNNQLLRKTDNSMSMEKVANTIISLADRAIESDSSFLVLQDTDTGDLVCVAETSKDYRPDGHFRLAKDEESLATLVFSQDKTFAIADVQTDPRCSPRLRQQFNTRSVLATPLRLDGMPIGVLMCISSTTPRDYSARDEAVVQGLAREAALAINTQRLNELNKTSEIERREKDELIELLMNSTEEAIFGVDLDGTCIFVNRACVEMLGYDDESEFLGQSIHELIHHTRADGSHYPKAECSVRLATQAETGAHRDDEVHWRKDGTSLPVEYWSRPIRKDREIVGTVVTFVDITERRQAEKNLRESETSLRKSKEQLDKVVNSASIVLFAIDAGGIFTLSEGHGLQSQGLKPGLGVGESVYEVFKDVPRMLEDVEKALAGETIVSEVQINHLFFEMNFSPMLDEEGNVTGTMGVAQDVTPRKNVADIMRSLASTSALLDFDKFLHEALRNLTNLYDCQYAFVGRLLPDKQNVRTLAVRASGQAVENFSYNLEGTPCQNVLDLSIELVPENASEIYREDKMLVDMGVQSYFGAPMIGSTGELFGLVSVMDSRPMRPDEWSEPILRVFATRIAVELERKLANDALQENRDNLEEIVNSRTSELQNVNRELEAFSYSVSHDLRAPLRSIDGFSLAILEDYKDKLDETGRDYLNRVRNSAQRMSALIDDLLDLSRVTRSEIKREAVDLSALASGILQEFASSEPDRTVETQVAPGIMADGDKRLLKVALDNLLRNAWKYTGKTAKPEIEFGSINKNGAEAYYIRDNGAGFDMKYSDKLFGAFQRLHKSSEFPGTGIGLATVQRIVHRHGGRVWAESEPGNGATFFFSLSAGFGGDDGK